MSILLLFVFSTVFYQSTLDAADSQAMEKAVGYRICQDHNSNCGAYKSYGYCTHKSYTSWMNKNCQKSCGKCPSAAELAQCVDYDARCKEWNSKNYCVCGPYPDFVNEQCPKICGRCVALDHPYEIMEPGVACPNGNQMEEPWRCEDAATVLAEEGTTVLNEGAIVNWGGNSDGVISSSAPQGCYMNKYTGEMDFNNYENGKLTSFTQAICKAGPAVTAEPVVEPTSVSTYTISEPNTACTSGEEIPSIKECEEAANLLNGKGAKSKKEKLVQWDGNGKGYLSSSSPSGCQMNMWQGKIGFNTHTGRLTSYTQTICKASVSLEVEVADENDFCPIGEILESDCTCNSVLCGQGLVCSGESCDEAEWVWTKVENCNCGSNAIVMEDNEHPIGSETMKHLIDDSKKRCARDPDCVGLSVIQNFEHEGTKLLSKCNFATNSDLGKDKWCIKRVLKYSEGDVPEAKVGELPTFSADNNPDKFAFKICLLSFIFALIVGAIVYQSRYSNKHCYYRDEKIPLLIDEI